MNNYLPISNLPFTYKLMEKVVAELTEEHRKSNDLYDSHQSFDKNYHSAIGHIFDEESLVAFVLFVCSF